MRRVAFVIGMTLFLVAMALAQAWLIGAKWGFGAVPDPIRRWLGVTPPRSSN
jgi:hypothetical protein